MIGGADRARVLRECAVDLIRASDLADASNATLVEIQSDRLRRVQADLAEIEQQLRDRVLVIRLRYPAEEAA